MDKMVVFLAQTFLSLTGVFYYLTLRMAEFVEYVCMCVCVFVVHLYIYLLVIWFALKSVFVFNRRSKTFLIKTSPRPDKILPRDTNILCHRVTSLFLLFYFTFFFLSLYYYSSSYKIQFTVRGKKSIERSRANDVDRGEKFSSICQRNTL